MGFELAPFAFLFPGQGSQSVGMLPDLFKNFPTARLLVEEAEDTAKIPLIQYMQAGPNELLSHTETVQPLLLALDVALWQYWTSEIERKPDVLAGHSLGECAALVCAGAISYAEAIKLVCVRAKFMQKVTETVAEKKQSVGLMAILGLGSEDVADMCQSVTEALEGDSKGKTVEVANYNAPTQVVISGHADLLVKVGQLAKSKKAKAIKLPVAVPAHSSLMKDAVDEFMDYLQGVQFSALSIPVVSSVTAKDITDQMIPQGLRTILAEQLAAPVLWVQTMETLINQYGCLTFVECGPGNVLSNLAKRIDRRVQTNSLSSTPLKDFLQEGKSSQQSMLEA